MSQITGVGYLLFKLENGIPLLYTGKEKKPKPHLRKEAGMVSFPFETMEESDKTLRATFDRLIEEEIDHNLYMSTICEIVEEGFHSIHNGNIVIFYGYGIFFGDQNKNFEPLDTDVQF